MKNKAPVKIIDQLMGKGKTSWAIQYMNTHKEKSFVFCTPFLEEINRIKEKCQDRNFRDPQHRHGGRKIDDFNDLLMEGCDIVVTHSTFQNSTAETYKYIKNAHYCLILDEALDVLKAYNDVCDDVMSNKDIQFLIRMNCISVDSYGKVNWIDGHEEDGTMKYDRFKNLVKKGHVFFIAETLLVWCFPPKIFECFEEVYVLTYMFKGSFMKPYFEYHNIDYELKGLKTDETGIYYLCEWEDDKSSRNELKQLVNIFYDEKMCDYKASSLSMAWYKKSQKKLPELQRHLSNYFKNKINVKSKAIMWTTYKNYKKDLQGNGYTIVYRVTKKQEEELRKEKTEREIKRIKDMGSCFVSCNARATNDFADRYVLAYAINRYAHPYLLKYFENKNKQDGTNIRVDEEYYALAEMLQWIWRSRIRKGEPIYLYIPSTRMRNLFTDWLEGKM